MSVSVNSFLVNQLPSFVPTPLQRLRWEAADRARVEVYLKREDLIHPQISGNKWRKLKYNLVAANNLGHQTLLTFGGAYSSHIYAVAAVGHTYGFRTIGLIRGEEALPFNATLAFAQSCGMQLHYLSRERYRQKEEAHFLEDLKERFGSFYLIPEGGSNAWAVKGVAELVPELHTQLRWDYLCCAVGTGGTLAGLVQGAAGKGHMIGFSALKGGDFLHHEVEKWLAAYSGLTNQGPQQYANWHIQTGYHFGGYAKVTPELLQFIRRFEQENQVLIEQVYTGKMLYGLEELLRKEFFKPDTCIVAIHTGGLQGRLAGL